MTDVVIGTGIALAMGTAFTRLSSGMSLIVTFIPGLVFTWVTLVWLYVTRTKLPSGERFLPAFFALLAVQLIHLAEELTTGFLVKFPLLYGGRPYSQDFFVAFSVVSYCVVTVCCILAFTQGLRFLLMPALFFVIYAGIGNAIAHTWWSLSLRAYFPGLVSAQIFWVAGPLVLHRLTRARKFELALIVLLALAMIPLLTLFASPAAIRP
jgi:hypothetical protein